MKTTVVVLGGREFVVKQLPIALSRKWRERFAEPIEGVFGAVQMTGTLMGQEARDGAELGKLVGQIGAVLLTDVGKVLLGSMEMLFEMVCAYAPNVEAERKWLEQEAFDDEVMAAFVEVLKLAYPFGGLLNFVNRGQGKM